MRGHRTILSLLVGLLFVFCPLTDFTLAQEAARDLPKILRWGTLPVGFANYQESVGMGEIIKKYTPMTAKIEPTLGDLVWGPMLNKGELDFGYQSFTGPLWGYLGLGPYKGKEPLKNLRLVGQGTPLIYVVLTRKEPGIKRIADLRGKRIANPVGIFYWKSIFLAMLEANGMTEKDVKIIDSTTAAEMKNDLISGKIDGIMFSMAPLILEIDAAQGAYVIPLTKAEQDNVIKRIRGVKAITSPAGMFKMPATPAVYGPGAIITRVDQKNDVVYEVVKAIYGHTSELSNYSPNLAGYHLGKALDLPALPVHPGAIRYYKEKWLWDEELDHNNNDLLAAEKK